MKLICLPSLHPLGSGQFKSGRSLDKVTQFQLELQFCVHPFAFG